MPKSPADAEARLKTLYPEGGPGRQLKTRLKAGEVLVGGTIGEYARPSLMKLYQQAGYDFVYIEFEHVYFGLDALADAVLAARDNGLPVIAKTPQLERAEVAKLLECGIVGIQLPRTESRQDVETLKDYIKPWKPKKTFKLNMKTKHWHQLPIKIISECIPNFLE